MAPSPAPDSPGTADPAERQPVDRVAARAGLEQRPGRRALRTRQRLLDATAKLVGSIPYRDLTTALVCQEAGLSPPAFYRYFAGINDAVLELTDAMRSSGAELAAQARSGTWDSGGVLGTCVELVEGFAAFWAEHRALYRVTDLLAEEGEPRFRQIKQATFAELTAVLADEIARRCDGVRHPAEVDPYAAASVAVTALVHVMAREPAFAAAGVPVPALRLQLARMTAATVIGRFPQ